MLSNEFVQRMKDKLTDEKERLSEELSGMSEHTEMNGDLEDTAQEFEIDEVNHDIIDQLKVDIKKVDAALEKIEKGTYGTCEVGGEQISEARLDAIPWAETCTEHEAK